MKYNKSYLLIDPIYNNGDIPPNISLGQIEYQLINSGYNVELVDFVEPSCEHGGLSDFFQMEQRFFLKILEKAQKANIVYISGGYGNALKPYPFFPRIIQIAQLLKKAYPSLYIVAGGALINYYKKIYNISDTLIKKGLIDYILVGNELSFIQLFTNGTFTNRRDLGYCNWHNWEIGKYPNYRSILYHIGCPYKCDFCFEGKIYNQNFIIETQDSFINTMCSAIENGNIRNFIIEDSTFISYKDFDTIIERIKDLGISFSIYARISEIIGYPSRVKQLKNAGCCAFIIGFETLDDNFLIDQNILSGIVSKAEINKNVNVIEIGPGLGTLTKYLLEKAGKVLCIELDTRMIEILEDRFSIYKNFEVINEDVLKVNLNEIIKENKKDGKTSIFFTFIQKTYHLLLISKIIFYQNQIINYFFFYCLIIFVF